MKLRQSHLALVIIKLRLIGEDFFLFQWHRKWNDWSLVGGHVEPNEENDWNLTAVREVEEELYPLKVDEDFIVCPLSEDPVSWGPVLSRSSAQSPTIYTAQWFVLRFLRDPTKALARLPVNDFLLISSQTIYGYKSRDGIAITDLCKYIPVALNAIPPSWPGQISQQEIPVQIWQSNRLSTLFHEKQ